MVDLPKGYPMWCRDIKHIMSDNNITKDQLPVQDESTHHNALDDARWNQRAFDLIQQIISYSQSKEE